MNLVIGGETIHYTIKKQTDKNHITRKYFRASAVIRRDPDTGHLIRKEVTAPSEEKLRVKLLELQHIRPLEAGSEQTLKEYLEKWIDQNSFLYSPNSVRNQRYYAGIMIRSIGSCRLWELNEEIIREFYRQLVQKRGTGVALNTRRVLNRAFNDAAARHLIYGNPQSDIHLQKNQRKAIIPLNRDESAQLIALCRKDTVYGGVIACGLLLGLRISECTGLAVSDYDVHTNTIRIHQQICETSGHYIHEDHTKNKSERILHPSTLAVEFLQRQLKLQYAWKKQAQSAWNNSYNCLFTNSKGHFLTHDAIREHLRKMTTAIGRTDFKFHHLRHTCATIVHTQPDGITIARDILGHKYYETTSSYIHSSPEQQLSALEMVADYASGPPDT